MLEEENLPHLSFADFLTIRNPSGLLSAEKNGADLICTQLRSFWQHGEIHEGMVAASNVIRNRLISTSNLFKGDKKALTFWNLNLTKLFYSNSAAIRYWSAQTTAVGCCSQLHSASLQRKSESKILIKSPISTNCSDEILWLSPILAIGHPNPLHSGENPKLTSCCCWLPVSHGPVDCWTPRLTQPRPHLSPTVSAMRISSRFSPPNFSPFWSK